MSATMQQPGTGSHALLVPATDEGRAFLKSLRKYANYDHIERIRPRARGPRAEVARADGERVARYFQDLPVRHARAFAVYIDTRTPQWQANASRYAAESIERHYTRMVAAQQMELYWSDRAHALEMERARIPAWIRRFFNWLHERRQA